MDEKLCTLQARLFALQDSKYQAFHRRLIPTVPPERVIGVRMPALRRLARELGRTPEAAGFLRALPHIYYEEDALHGLLINDIRDYDAAIAALTEFLPHVDNWATCDLLSPRAFRTHPDALPSQIQQWLHSPQPYTVRFGIGVLLGFYLDEAFCPEQLEWVAAIRSEEYYVNMMIAWYFATALAKQPQAATPYLQQRRLAPWVHNKTIQKAIESYRITPEQKQALRQLRIPRGTRA